MSKLEDDEVLRVLIALTREGDRDALIELCEAIREEGGVVMLKLDGERRPSEPGYTCLISQGRLPHGAQARADVHTLEEALARCVERYLESEAASREGGR